MWSIGTVLVTIIVSAPAWAANAVTAIFWYTCIIRKKLLPAWPIDGGLLLGGRRLLGDSRTLFGSLFMVVSATALGYLQGNIYLGLMFGLFTLSGTLLNSFIKRRLNISTGGRFFVDHIDYALTVVAGLYVCDIMPDSFNPLFFILWVFVFQFSINAIARKVGMGSARVHQGAR